MIFLETKHLEPPKYLFSLRHSVRKALLPWDEMRLLFFGKSETILSVKDQCTQNQSYLFYIFIGMMTAVKESSSGRRITAGDDEEEKPNLKVSVSIDLTASSK